MMIAVSRITGADGTCMVNSGTFPAKKGEAELAVTGATHPDLTYAAAVNHDPDGDSTGTTIQLSK